MVAAKALADDAVVRLDQVVGCGQADEEICATAFIRSFGERTYRRPPKEDEVRGPRSAIRWAP